MKKKSIATFAVLLLVSAGVFWVSASPPRPQAEEEEMTRFLEIMNRYLTLSDRYLDITARPEGASYLALEGITEIYQERRQSGKAVEHLQRILEKTPPQNRALRNLVRLKLKEVLAESGRSDEALRELDRIIDENSKLR